MKAAVGCIIGGLKQRPVFGPGNELNAGGLPFIIWLLPLSLRRFFNIRTGSRNLFSWEVFPSSRRDIRIIEGLYRKAGSLYLIQRTLRIE